MELGEFVASRHRAGATLVPYAPGGVDEDGVGSGVFTSGTVAEPVGESALVFPEPHVAL